MGQEEKKQEEATAPAPAKSGLPWSVRFAMAGFLVLSAVFLPFTIVFAVCMIPTFVAIIVDDQSNRSAWFTVGVMNLAGTIPALFSLWYGGFKVVTAFHLIINPMTIIVSFGAAAGGWLIYHKVPRFVAQVLFRKNERRLKEIDRRLKDLVRKWGEDVAAG